MSIPTGAKWRRPMTPIVPTIDRTARRPRGRPRRSGRGFKQLVEKNHYHQCDRWEVVTSTGQILRN